MREEILMQHNESTVRQLSRIQYATFSAGERILLLLISLLLILLGFGLLYDFGKPFRYVLLALGCILIVNTGVLSDLKADKTLSAIKKQGGEYPCTKMIFTDSSIQITEKGSKSHQLNYADIYHLVEDKEFCYLFLTREAAYMVPKEQIVNLPAFMDFLEKTTGKTFTRPRNLFTTRLKDILVYFKK